jgi:protein-disulfide isomerase
MQMPATEATVKRNLALASALAIDGTPGFVIGTRVLVGPSDLSALHAAIRDARSGTSTMN